MTNKTEKIIFGALKVIVPKLEQYRAKNVTKYNAENELLHGGEYSTKERYKNRVRLTDIFLPSIKKMVELYELQLENNKEEPLE